MIAALAPGGGGDAAAAQEVMDTIADSQTGSIDFSGFLHFFSMVRASAQSVTLLQEGSIWLPAYSLLGLNHHVIPSCSGRHRALCSRRSSTDPAACTIIHSWRDCSRHSHWQQPLK